MKIGFCGSEMSFGRSEMSFGDRKIISLLFKAVVTKIYAFFVDSHLQIKSNIDQK